MTREQEIALREAHCIPRVDGYFDQRPEHTKQDRRYYEAGFQAGWEEREHATSGIAVQPTPPAGLTNTRGYHAMLGAIASLREEAFYRDEEGEDTNALEELAQALATQPAPSTLVEWRPIDSAPEGEPVLVFWLADYDDEHPERYDIDYLEDGCWMKHADEHDHYIMVGGPSLGPGPKEKAPYTHWKPVLPLPVAASPAGLVQDGEHSK